MTWRVALASLPCSFPSSDKLMTCALHRNVSGKPAGSVPLKEQNKYRYLVSTDGEGRLGG
jgi:hypothetical protein